MPTRRSLLLGSVAISAAAVAADRMTPAPASPPARHANRSIRTLKIPHTDLTVSCMAYGCNMTGMDPQRGDFIAKSVDLIRTAYDNGITFYDVADVYGDFKSEVALGEAFRQSPWLRHEVVLQTKCGILYKKDVQSEIIGVDLSHEHIIKSVEGSLKRLGADHIDILLLHQPDALVQPDEVAQALDELKDSGKVRYFGVSNYIAPQIDLLKKSVRQPLIVNQFSLGLASLYPTFNYPLGGSHYMAESGIIDYCRLNNIQVQAWSPLRGALLNPTDSATPEIRRTAATLAELAQRKGTTPAAVALAWLLRHPAGVVPILGSTNQQHLADDCTADEIALSRAEWYALFSAAGAAM